MLVFDCETHDPYLGYGNSRPTNDSRNLGAGWVYGINVAESDFKVLGVAIKEDNGPPKYLTMENFNEVREAVLGADTLVAHNIQYDLGCLYFLFKDDKEVINHLRKIGIIDTILMSKFYRSYLPSHSLDNLAKIYLGKEKEETGLLELAMAASLIPKKLKTKASIMNHVKKQMSVLQELDLETVAHYAKVDVELTYDLYKHFEELVDVDLVKQFGKIYKVLCEQRLKGVRFDLQRAMEIKEDLNNKLKDKERELYDLAGREFKINSSKQTAIVFDEFGYNYSETDKGNPCFSKAELAGMDHKLAELILEVKKIKKINTDFIEKFIAMQKWTCPGATDYGRLYPEFNLLSARTGRFSCNAPNIQQIPADKVYGPLCRSLFVAEEGEEWHSLDFSNQEGRLQLHYAALLECRDGKKLQKKMQDNPHWDIHQEVANLLKVDRKTAKGINLGLSYGMGIEKLSWQLGICIDQAKKLKKAYFRVMPYLEDLINKCKYFTQANGYIDSISGRTIAAEPPNETGQTFTYKALNQLIQGSAADQTIFAMIKAYEMGLPPMFSVHDEVNFSGTKEQAKLMEECMKTAFELNVPIVVDVASGNNWGECL